MKATQSKNNIKKALKTEITEQTPIKTGVKLNHLRDSFNCCKNTI